MNLDPIIFSVIAGVVGLCIGSFLNVVIFRLPKMMDQEWQAQCAELRGETPVEGPVFNLVLPRSRCPACGHQINALENIPLVSYLALRGKCRACKTPISVRYPAVEALTGLLTAYAAFHFGPHPHTVAYCVFIWTLIALTFIDFDTQLLPDSLTQPLLWAGLIANVTGIIPAVSLSSALWGAVAGYLSLWTVYWLFKIIRGKEGMGYGDFKLLAAIGAWLGWQILPLVILLSSLVGAIIGICLVVFKGRDHQIPLAFGPYLAIAGIVALFWGEPLIALYFPK